MHRAGLGFAGALVEKLVTQRQDQKESQEESRKGQTGQADRELKVYGESRVHRLGLI